jgi:hypothetical protein
MMVVVVVVVVVVWSGTDPREAKQDAKSGADTSA